MMDSAPPAWRRHPIRSAAQRHLSEADPLGLQAVRGELEHRLKSQRERLDEHRRMARALRVGSAPPVLADVCRALCEHDLMGKNVLIIGTNAVYAYEALAGVRLQGPDGQCKFPRLRPPQTPPGKDRRIMPGRC
jgi:hypothetical protein